MNKNENGNEATVKQDDTTTDEAIVKRDETTSKQDETTYKSRDYWFYLNDEREEGRRRRKAERRFKKLSYEKQMKIVVDSLDWIGVERLKALNLFYQKLIERENRWEQFNSPPTEEEWKKSPVKIITPCDFIRVVIERGLEALNDEYCKRAIYCASCKTAKEEALKRARKRFWEKRLYNVTKNGRRLGWFNFPTRCAGWYN